MQKFPLITRGFRKLDAELKVLKSERRPAVIRAIAKALEHGDLSETNLNHRPYAMAARQVRMQYLHSIPNVLRRINR